jgi:hypothetical protein
MALHIDFLKSLTERMAGDAEFVAKLKWVLSGKLSADDLAEIANVSATLAKAEEMLGVAPGTLDNDAPLDYDPHDARYGAERLTLDAEIDRLRRRFCDDDLRWLAETILELSGPPPRNRRTSNRKSWDSAEGRQAKFEIMKLHKLHGLSQEEACVQWQDWCREAPSRGDYSYFTEIDAQTLRKAVFDR